MADRTITTVVAIMIVGCLAIGVVAIDAYYSTSGTGTISSIAQIPAQGAYPQLFKVTVFTGSGTFTTTISCNIYHVGDSVRWTHDWFDGYEGDFNGDCETNF